MKLVREVHDLVELRESIKNYIWYGLSHAEGDYDKLIEFLHFNPFHISGVHSFPNNTKVRRCAHGPEYDTHNKKYLSPNSAGVQKLTIILNNPRLLEFLKKATNFKHTDLVETVNSIIWKYSSKRTFSRQRGMTAKICCAAMSYNENINRKVVLEENGHPKMYIQKKRFGPPRARQVHEAPTRKWNNCCKAKFLEYYTEERRL